MFALFGLGKERTRFGKWVDKNESQEWVVKNCGIDKNTVSRLCNNKDYKPNGSTRGRVIMGLNKNGYRGVIEEDFWPN
ncbi:transcriptional regulator [Paenibacillus naphthalenovorans]|uniref:transcriptional regulator n=1 Tax=Paenibacillus naphthalenovorans TaxID=162209 RepID=UPI003D28E43B